MKRIVLTLAAAVFLMPVATYAAGLTVVPATFDARLEPGQSLDIAVSIENSGDAPLVLYPSVRDVVGMDEAGNPIFAKLDDPKTGGELSSFVSFKEKTFTLQPGEKYELVATVTLPANAPQGGLFGLVGASQQPEGETDATGVIVGMQIGSLVSLRVGEALDDARVIEFRASEWFKSGSDTTFVTSIENTGTALVRPYGIIQIRDMFGRTIATTSFNEMRRGILPASTAKIDTAWEPGRQLFGRFEATLAATYGVDVKKSLVNTATFWVFPVKLTTIIVGVALLFFLAIYLWVRSYIKRALRKSGSDSATPRGSASFFSVFIAIVAVAAIIIGIVFFLLA